MQSLPEPCPADLIPNATGLDAFHTVYKAAKQQQAIFVAIEQGPQWMVKADTLTAPQRTIDITVHDAIRAAVSYLIRAREIRADSTAGPIYFELYDVGSEQRARELAAALHAALYTHLEPLRQAVKAA
ncbi:hypothetical protein [Streptomyces chartreusis]|uniref:hypothetical protein n=1 Tax=Streptomyces chartreusis TaxID=1969 RepID=UPI003818F446